MSNNKPAVYRCSPCVSTLIVVISALVLTCSTPAPSSAQDAHTIMQNMMTAYERLTSYRGQSKGTMRQAVKGGKVVTEDGFTTTLTYQKPNMLKVEFVMPSGGRTVYCDGQTITYYNNQTQTFASALKKPRDIHEVAACLLELQIAGRYDALYFLSGNRLPQNVTGLKRLPDSERNDRPVYVITAHETTQTHDIKWTWMIDKQTMMLAHVEGRTWNEAGTVIVLVGRNSGRNKVPLEGILTQSILTPSLNKVIPPTEFQFKVPQNARSVKYKAVVEQQRRDFSGSSAAPAADQ